MSDNETQTADANAGTPMTDEQRAQADIVAADVDAAQATADAVGVGEASAPEQGTEIDLAAAMKEAQAAQIAAASDAVEARSFTDPSATYVRGVEGANVNVAAPKDAPVISTYEQAQEAGYFGVAPGYANTDKLSVQAVAERDRKLGLPGTKGLTGSVVNGAGGDATANEDGETSTKTAKTRKSQRS